MGVFKINRISVIGKPAGKLVGFRKPLSSQNVPGHLIPSDPNFLRLDALVKTGDKFVREPGVVIKGNSPVFMLSPRLAT